LPKQKIFYGWIITGAVFCNLAIAYGAQYSFGVLFPSMIAEFNWDRQSLSGAFSLYAFIYTLLAFLLGRWADRFGPRIVLICGSICLGLGIALIGQINAPWHLYLIYGLLASWGMSAVYITSPPTIVKWFIEKRGLALGIAQSGHGVGTILIPLGTGLLISTFGWRQACLILGLAVFIVLFGMSLFLIDRPEKRGLLPDGRRNRASGKTPKADSEIFFREDTWSASEAIHTQSFWVLTMICFCTWLFIFFPLVHLVVFAMDIGLSMKSALTALSVLGGFSALGRLVMGSISDHIGRKTTLAINLGVQAFSWFWIMSTNTSWMLVLFSALFGLSYGGVSAVWPAITGDYFGRLKAASIIGAIFTIAGPASAIGPLLGGTIYDLTRSYQMAFLLGALTNLVAFILVFKAKPPRRKIDSPS
jgi:MFS transporter, OFA family, oxalate/formate antiporter